MKTIIKALVLVAALYTTSAKAQKHFVYSYRPSTVVVAGGGYYPYYPAFGLFYGYPYYYPNGSAYPPSKLDIQVANIKNDYADKIESVRLDNSLTGKERRQKIREFRKERDAAVLEAKQNYYKSVQ